jgi:hypothetical protein
MQQISPRMNTDDALQIQNALWNFLDPRKLVLSVVTSSGSFDSTSFPLRGREVPLRMTEIKFLDLPVEIQAEPIPKFGGVKAVAFTMIRQ